MMIKKKYRHLLALLLSFYLLPVHAAPSGNPLPSTPITPNGALLRLKQGNLRFLNTQQIKRNYLATAKYTSQHGQHPFAIILSCIDSRGVPEIAFDQGLGDIFTARVAGNVINSDMLGSMEYATQVVGSPLIVVMGHTQCGAVTAACKKVTLGHITDLVRQITPAVETVKSSVTALNCKNGQLINRIAKQNVLDQMQLILKQSAIIRKLVTAHRVKLVGAMHDISTGTVVFFDGRGKSI